MPQLSPLNWVLLFCFFWIVLVLVVISTWWLDYKVLSFEGSQKESYAFFHNEWLW